MTSYKLVQYLRHYINMEEIQSLIEIKSRTVCNWLYKLGFEYKDVKNTLFIDKHKRPNIVENCKKILNAMKDLEPYLVEFKEKGLIKRKKYMDNCKIGGDKRCFVNIITYNEFIFFANNEIWKA